MINQITDKLCTKCGRLYGRRQSAYLRVVNKGRTNYKEAKESHQALLKTFKKELLDKHHLLKRKRKKKK